MKMVNGMEKCFEFLGSIYDEIPKFDELKLSEIDSGLLKEKGLEEVFFKTSNKIETYHSKYGAVVRIGGYEYAIAFDNNVIIYDSHENIIYEKTAPSIWAQLAASRLSVDSILLIMLDERCNPNYLNKRTSRSLTLYFSDKAKDSESFKLLMHNIEVMLCCSEEQAIVLDSFREELDVFAD